MPIYPYSFQLPPLNVQDIPNDGVAGEFLGINGSGVLDWLPVASGGGDMLKSENLSGLANYTTARTNIGLGTTSTPTFANLTLTSPSLTADAPVTISQTWNQIGTAFTAFKVNAVSTASASGSLLLDLQVGGASKFKVDKDGAITTQAIFALNTSLQFIFAGNRSVMLGIGDLRVSGGSTIGWSSNGTHADGGPPDTILVRDGAANTLALRNGAAAQTFNVYGTWTTAITNFERLAIKYNTTDVAYQIAAEKGTTNGDYRPLQLWTGGASRLHVTTAGNVGIGTTSPTSKLHVAETWNNAGTAFCAIKSVITDTNSAAGSDFLELYSGTSTQPLRMDINKTGQINAYGTWTDAGNYERLSFNPSDGVFSYTPSITTQQAGSGGSRHLNIGTTGTADLRLATSSLWRWRVGGSTGHLLAHDDNTYDIGASGANRPRNVYVGSNVISRPAASITPANNGEFVVEATSNTTLTFKLKGTDGTVRTGTITLA